MIEFISDHYTKDAGLEINHATAVKNGNADPKLHWNSTGAYGGKGGFRPPCVLQTSEQIINAMTGKWGGGGGKTKLFLGYCL